MNTQSITGKEKKGTISSTDVKRIVDLYNDNNHNNKNNNNDDDEVVQGDDNDNDNDNDDSSLLSELLQDKVNSTTASRDSFGTISYFFTDDEYDYRKSTIDKDDIDDDDDDDNDKEDYEKSTLPRNYFNNNRNNGTTTTGMNTKNRRRVLKKNQNNSQLSDITFDSDHYYDNNELMSLNDNDSMTSLLGESLTGKSRWFAPMMPRRSSNSSSTTNPPSMPVRNLSNH
mmetsp:Transcript_52984/g.57525  ORF Transcript_52984/g.57525 Transcript_52984/m.57525 type:complete len:227 (-) Transcript_52984:188-868(-)